MAPIRGTLKQHRRCGFINTHPIPIPLLANASSRHKWVPQQCSIHPKGRFWGASRKGKRKRNWGASRKGKASNKRVSGEQKLNPSPAIAAILVSYFRGMSPAGGLLRQSRKKSLWIPVLASVWMSGARTGGRAATFLRNLELFKKPVCSRRFIGRLCLIK